MTEEWKRQEEVNLLRQINQSLEEMKGIEDICNDKPQNSFTKPLPMYESTTFYGASVNQNTEDMDNLDTFSRSKNDSKRRQDWGSSNRIRKTGTNKRYDKPEIKVTRTVRTGGMESEVDSLNSDLNALDTTLSPLRNLQRFKMMNRSAESFGLPKSIDSKEKPGSAIRSIDNSPSFIKLRTVENTPTAIVEEDEFS